MALAALARQGEPVRNRWVLGGALIPDLAIFLWAPWQKWALGREWNAIWDQHYFEPPMQTLIALFNSVPIYAVILVVGVWQRQTRWGVILILLSCAALLHIALDAPVHGHDAYRHMWPLSNWRFYSPVSYWDGDLHARWVSFVEAMLVIMSVIVLWRRFPKLWVKITLGLLLAFTLIGTGAQQLAAIDIPR